MYYNLLTENENAIAGYIQSLNLSLLDAIRYLKEKDIDKSSAIKVIRVLFDLELEAAIFQLAQNKQERDL